MKSARIARFAATALVLGVGIAAVGPMDQAVSASSSHNANVANRYAAKANKFLARPKAADKLKAITWAEQAVARSPGDAALRFLLGRTYLTNGRMNSAETSFADALALDPGNARAALNLALMKASRAQNVEALALLESNRNGLDAADYGLALALAGDTSGGVASLEATARAAGATSRVRQNLALAYALAGRWPEARVVVAQDLALDMVDARLASWASLAHPRASWDQVAGVLGVRPVYDPGQLPQIALIMQPAPQQAAEASPPPPAPVEPVRATQASFAAEPAPVYEAPVAEPVAPMPVAAPYFAPLITASKTPLKQAVVPVPVAAKSAAQPVAATRGVESGRFVVQLGAFSGSSRAEVAWNSISNKLSELRNYDPVSARVKVKAGSFYRLSVSGFTTREAAGQVCTRIKSAGGVCFVRTIAGDTPIVWAQRKSSGGMKLAARR